MAAPECRCLNMVIHRVDRKWMGASFNKFYCKIWDGFCLNTGKWFLLEVYFKANRKTFCSSKKRARDFKNSLPFKEFRMFLCENHWDFLNVFNTLTLKKVSEKVKHIWKTGVPSFISKYCKWKNNIFMQNCSIKSQC